jgi:hypothetical protein
MKKLISPFNSLLGALGASAVIGGYALVNTHGRPTSEAVQAQAEYVEAGKIVQEAEIKGCKDLVQEHLGLLKAVSYISKTPTGGMNSLNTYPDLPKLEGQTKNSRASAGEDLYIEQLGRTQKRIFRVYVRNGKTVHVYGSEGPTSAFSGTPNTGMFEVRKPGKECIVDLDNLKSRP